MQDIRQREILARVFGNHLKHERHLRVEAVAGEPKSLTRVTIRCTDTVGWFE
jgi:hypothetical protein